MKSTKNRHDRKNSIIEWGIGTVLALSLLFVPNARGSENVLNFSGTDSYVDLGMPSVLQLATDSPLTIEGWVYLNSVDDRDMLYSKNDGRGAGYTHLFGFYNSGRIAAYTGSAWREPNPIVTVDTERWMHVAFSFDGTNLTYYIDGESVGASAFNYNNVEANTVKLGGYHSGSDINGMKSEIRVWDHGRSEQEIKDGQYYRLTGAEPGLLGYWPLNEGAGTDALDYSGNNSTGTVINASWTTTEDLTFLPPDAGFLPAESFTLADIETGNPSYTISNEVEVTSFPIPENHDRYQVTESGDASSVDTNAWTSTNSLPTQLSFTTPLTATNITLYAWFTNSVTNVTMRRAEGKIDYIPDVSDTVLEFFPPASYVDLDNPEALQLPFEHPLTIEGWVNFKSLGDTDMLFSKNNASRGGDYSYMFGVRDSGTKFSAYTGHGGSPATTWVDIPLAEALQTERWYHLAFAYDGTNLAGYVDGVKVGEAEYSYGNYDAHTVTIGGYADTTDPNALRADVRLWDHARDTKDIAAYLDRRLSGAESGLVGYWPLNDWSATKVFDRTAQGSTGTIVNARATLSEGFSLASPPNDFSLASAFTLADIETGSDRFTNSNEVDVTTFPLPEGYDRYQITDNGDVSSVDTNAWSSTNTIPPQLDFTKPAHDTNIVFYAWFTNSVTNATLLRGEGSIYYTEVLPAPNVRPTLTRERLPGSNVVIHASDLDLGSTGGEANGIVLDVVDRIALAVDPGDDLTPDDPWVTLSELGEYTLSLSVMNEAGNVATSTATCTLTIEEYVGQFIWTGDGEGSDWHDVFNWNVGVVPIAGEPVVISNGVSVFLGESTPALGSLWLTNATLTMANWDTVLEADTVTIDAGGVITLPGAFSDIDMSNRIHIVCGDLLLAENGVLHADGLGYEGQSGPGTTAYTHVGVRGSGGAGYGGIGGRAAAVGGSVYGDPVFPVDPGSGSGGTERLYGESGGGAIHLNVARHATLDGLVTANGDPGRGAGGYRYSGGGSGGSILLICETVSGSGTLQAKGGDHYYHETYPGGGGGGGRISVHFDPTAQASLSRPGLTLSAAAGATGLPRFADNFWDQSDPGSLYLTAIDEVFDLTSPIDGINGYLLEPGLEQRSFGDLTVLSGSALGFDTNIQITVNGNLTVADGGAWISRHALELDCNGNVENQGRIFLRNENLLTIAGGVDVIGAEAEMALFPTQLEIGLDLDLRDAAVLRFYGAPTNGLPEEVGGEVAVSGDFRIETGASAKLYSDPYNGGSVRVTCRNLFVDSDSGIDADSKGFRADQGPGTTAYTGTSSGGSAGAGHGGRGGDSSGGRVGGSTYGCPLLPRDAGSAAGSTQQGRSDAGGSVIWIDADDRIDLNGTLSARGGDGFSGGGARHRGGCAGGSILLLCRSMTGTGSLGADGGDGYDDGTNASGGGGGGRIAVWYGLDREERQPLLDSLGEAWVTRRTLETESIWSFDGTAISVAGGTGYADGGEDGTLNLFRLLAPPGTMILLR